MLTSITLQNFKSFGELQSLPLEPITVLVGPNNSGKSAFMSVGRFVATCIGRDRREALAGEGGPDFLRHRPPVGDLEVRISWGADSGEYQTRFDLNAAVLEETLKIFGDRRGDLIEGWFRSEKAPQAWVRTFEDGTPGADEEALERDRHNPFAGLARRLGQGARKERYETLLSGLPYSRLIKLSLVALQRDADVVAEPVLAADGGGLAAVLALWRGADLEKAQRLDEFLQRCLPEVKHALVRPAADRRQRLWVQQNDGETFDAAHLSDGVLYFVALAMHVIDAPRHAVLFIEEPEQSIHPRRLSLIVDALRTLVQERQCQFVIATHSPTLLNEFRDEPEAILLFRRGEQGTRVKRLSDIPHLTSAFQDALLKAEPGRLLADGFFNDASLF